MGNVIDLKSFKRKEKVKENPDWNKDEKSFSEAMKLNESNKKRVEEERKKTNKSTLRSYRIKN